MTSNINQDIQKYLDYLANVENLDFNIDTAAVTREAQTAKEYLATSALDADSTVTTPGNLDLFLGFYEVDPLDLVLSDTYSTGLTVIENWGNDNLVQNAYYGISISQGISLLGAANPPIIANAGKPLSELVIRDLEEVIDIYNGFTDAEWNEINQLDNQNDVQGQIDWWHETPEREKIFLTVNVFYKIVQNQFNWSSVRLPEVFPDRGTAITNFIGWMQIWRVFSFPSNQDRYQLQFGGGVIPATGSEKNTLTEEERREGMSKVVDEHFLDFLQNNTATDFTSPDQFFDAWFDYAKTNSYNVFQAAMDSNLPPVTEYILSPVTGKSLVLRTDGRDFRRTGTPFTLDLFQFATQGEEDAFKANLSSTTVGLLLPDFVESLRAVDDWADLKLSDAQIATLFQQTLLGYVNYLTSGSAPITEDFFTGWGNFIGPYLLFGAGPGEDPETAMLRTFEDIWSVFMGPERRADFLGKLSGLVNQTIQNGKPFIPGMLVDEWFQEVSALYFKENCIIDPTSSVKEADFEFVDLLLRIYDLLVEMLGFLQNMAAAQVSRENFLTKYEGAYTDYISQIPSYTVSDPNLGEDTGGSNSLKREIRQDLAGLNTKYTENLKGFRSGVEDLGKQQRTQVTQTNEAVAQQANMATTILQQFSSLLQSIWR